MTTAFSPEWIAQTKAEMARVNQILAEITESRDYLALILKCCGGADDESPETELNLALEPESIYDGNGKSVPRKYVSGIYDYEGVEVDLRGVPNIEQRIERVLQAMAAVDQNVQLTPLAHWFIDNGLHNRAQGMKSLRPKVCNVISELIDIGKVEKVKPGLYRWVGGQSDDYESWSGKPGLSQPAEFAVGPEKGNR